MENGLSGTRVAACSEYRSLQCDCVDIVVARGLVVLLICPVDVNFAPELAGSCCIWIFWRSALRENQWLRCREGRPVSTRPLKLRAAFALFTDSQ